MRFFSSLYHVRDGAVWFEGRQCPGAKAASFVNLGYGWAKSDQHVFHQGSICRGIDAGSVELLNALYVRDARGIHHYMKALLSKDRAEFRVLDPGYYSQHLDWDTDLHAGGYARDTTGVWWHHRSVRGADPVTFQSLRSGYGIDTKAVYQEEKRIAQADPATFMPCSARLALDRNHVFFAGTIIPQLNPDYVQKMLVGDIVYDASTDLIADGAKRVLKETGYLKLVDDHIAHLANMRKLIAERGHHRAHFQQQSGRQWLPPIAP